MKRVIKLKESDLIKIVESIINEQTQPFYTPDGKFNIGGPMSKPKGAVDASIIFPNIRDGKYPQKIDPKQVVTNMNTQRNANVWQDLLKHTYTCLNNTNLNQAVVTAIKDHKLNPLFVRYALGILGRESDFGKMVGNSMTIMGVPVGDYLPSRYGVKAVPEYIYNWMDDDNPLKGLVQWGMKKYKGQENWVPSMGIAQMTPEVAKKYGVDIEDLMTMAGSLVAATSYLKDLYNQLKIFDETKPTVIAQGDKEIVNPNSTGNGRLDAAIMAYNSGGSKYNRPFCKSKDQSKMKQGLRTLCSADDAIKGSEIKNYARVVKFQGITSLGYLKEVKERGDDFSCVK